MKMLLPVLGFAVVACSFALPALPAAADTGAAITRSQTNATTNAIRQQTREATRKSREKHKKNSEGSIATAPSGAQ